MTNVQEKLKLKRLPSDIWSIREQLCLASSILKSKEQNWINISRSVKQIVDKESLQTPDRYSQKSCTQQYSYLMENTDLPKRKKKESTEIISESIVRRLTQDRITELTKILAAQREEYFQLRNEINLLKNGTVSDEKLQKMWIAIKEEENKTQTVVCDKKQQNKDVQSASVLCVQNVKTKISELLTPCSEEIQMKIEEEENKCIKSSLLTNLLKSQGSTIQTQTSIAKSPTIANLLCSNPKVPKATATQNASQLHQIVPNTAPNSVQERPSTSAPTLSMLLEQPSAGNQKVLQQQLNNVSKSVNLRDNQTSVQVQNTVQTRSSRLIQVNDPQISQMPIITDSVLTNAEIPPIIKNPVDKVIHMNKDEINEIIGDIEELIKEEITESPRILEPSLKKVASYLDEKAVTTVKTELTKSTNVDEQISVSNSPASEISIGEIDSSTSNIAEIIGTTIGTINSVVNVCDPPKETKRTLLLKFANNDNDKLIVSDTCKGNKVKTESIINKDPNYEVENKVIDKEKIFVINKLNIDQEKILKYTKTNEKNYSNFKMNSEQNDKKSSFTDNTIKITSNVTSKKETPSETINISLDDKIHGNLTKYGKNQSTLRRDKITKNKIIPNIIEEEEKKKCLEKDEEVRMINWLEKKIESEKITDTKKSVLKEDFIETLKFHTHDSQKNDKIAIESTKNYIKNNVDKQTFEVVKEGNIVKDCKMNNCKKLEEEKIIKCETILKKNKIEERVENDTIQKEEKLNDNEKINVQKVERKNEDCEDNYKDYNKQEKELKKKNESSIKKENVESVGSVEEVDEEESVLSKLSVNKAMKTYSKKQNTSMDSEPENELSGETADYKSWKKLIMSVYNTLATNKYASIFLRPITEDQAPGYHSIIFRPMDLWTIKKNIDNGTIRSTAHFQRDVMLMFQNAIMFNKHNTFVHKMTLEMREECLQHMQIFVQAAGEASSREYNRRETRTATSTSNETPDSILKRKWAHITSNLHEIESPRVKKRRKSEND